MEETTADLDVDDAVSPSAPLYRQLMSAYAEESATEDAIYFLGDFIYSLLIYLYLILSLSNLSMFFSIYVTFN